MTSTCMCQNTTKHNEARIVCILLGIYHMFHRSWAIPLINLMCVDQTVVCVCHWQPQLWSFMILPYHEAWNITIWCTLYKPRTCKTYNQHLAPPFNPFGIKIYAGNKKRHKSSKFTELFFKQSERQYDIIKTNFRILKGEEIWIQL